MDNPKIETLEIYQLANELNELNVAMMREYARKKDEELIVLRGIVGN